MKAVFIEEFGGAEKLKFGELPTPNINQDEVLVRVRAAGVNLVDTMFRAGYMMKPEQLPVVMGSDFAGVVEQVGANISHVKMGDEVYGYKLGGNGTYAEYAAIPGSNVAQKPKSTDFVHTAGLGCVGLTAYNALIETLKIKAGENVLITAAAGGVGSLAVQIAASLGANVIATASERNREFLLGLGAKNVVDYEKSDFVEAVRAVYSNGVDAALTCIAGETKQKCPGAIRNGGRLAWISGEEKAGPPMERLIQGCYAWGKPDIAVFDELARMVDEGKLKVPIDQVFPLEKSREAQERMVTGKTRGKLIINIA